MNKSTHRVEVVPVVLEPHPNADSLSIVRVYGYTVVVRTEDWRGVDKGAYIVPDSVVPDTELFKFLGENRRIRVKRLRGVLSQGLLIPAPSDSRLGDDVADQLGVTRYEPTDKFTSGQQASPPPGYFPVYDLESWHRYGHLFNDGEEVIVTEKIHGTSARYVFVEDQFHVGSHRTWKQQDPDCLWWKIADRNTWIEKFCRNFPGYCLYGEIYGSVQDLKYGALKGEVWFRAFDILDRAGEWLQSTAVRFLLNIPKESYVPQVFCGPYSRELVEKLSVGKSTIADNLREGVVIEPWKPRADPEIGRLKLKLVSNEYLERG